jgi:hypothetical protein
VDLQRHLDYTSTNTCGVSVGVDLLNSAVPLASGTVSYVGPRVPEGNSMTTV